MAYLGPPSVAPEYWGFTTPYFVSLSPDQLGIVSNCFAWVVGLGIIRPAGISLVKIINLTREQNTCFDDVLGSFHAFLPQHTKNRMPP